MDYRKQYNMLIDKALARTPLLEKFEKHHIIPRCIGGSDDKDNLVTLTYREHFVAHVLLSKIHSDVSGLLYAAYLMSNKSKYTTSRNYHWLREKQVTNRVSENDILDVAKTTTCIDQIAKILDYKHHHRISNILRKHNIKGVRTYVTDIEILESAKTNHSYDAIARDLSYTNTSRIRQVLETNNIVLHRSGISEQQIVDAATNASSIAEIERILDYTGRRRIKSTLSKYNIILKRA